MDCTAGDEADDRGLHRHGITGTGSTSAPILAYGWIPGGQNAAAGSYADTVTVTVTFEAQRPQANNENSDRAIGSKLRSIALATDFGLPQDHTKTRKIQFRCARRVRLLIYILLRLQLLLPAHPDSLSDSPERPPIAIFISFAASSNLPCAEYMRARPVCTNHMSGCFCAFSRKIANASSLRFSAMQLASV